LIARDALGLVQENRNYQQQVKDAKAAAAQQIAQEKAQIARELQQAAEKFALEQQQRQNAYDQEVAQDVEAERQKIADAQANYAEEKKAAADAEKQKIKDLQDSYKDEKALREEQAWQEIIALGNAHDTQMKFTNKFYGDMQAYRTDFETAYSTGWQQWLDSLPLPDGSTIPGQASGGYAMTNGLYRRGEAGYEFVMNHDLTRTAEALVGTRLTQENLFRAMQGGST
jgi:hypothetical protein